MFRHTKAVFANTIKELNRIGYISLVIAQSLYIAFLTASVYFNFGLLVINIVLLIASVAHLTLCIISHKINFKDEEKIVTSGKKAYKHIKLGTQIFKVCSMFYGFFIASEYGSSLAIVYMIATTLLCIAQVLIECITPIIKKKFDLFVDALKYDFEGLIKTADFFNNLRGEKNRLWGDADKNRETLKEMAKNFENSKKQERKQNRKERHTEAKANFLAKFKKGS